MPIIASALFGAGIYIIILSILNYVVDAYQTYSASALAGVILIRNIVGGKAHKAFPSTGVLNTDTQTGGFPLFATQVSTILIIT